MKRELFPTSADIHGADCRCSRCDPYVPSTPLFADAATVTAAQLLAGLAIGVAGTWIYDAIVGGPGLLAGFGL